MPYTGPVSTTTQAPAERVVISGEPSLGTNTGIVTKLEHGWSADGHEHVVATVSGGDASLGIRPWSLDISLPLTVAPRIGANATIQVTLDLDPSSPTE